MGSPAETTLIQARTGRPSVEPDPAARLAFDRATGPGGTRANTARLLCAALRDMAGLADTASAEPLQAGAGLAMPLAVLWSRLHKFDAADALWPDRDRFVLSGASAAPLLHALLLLTRHAGLDQARPPHGAAEASPAGNATFGQLAGIEAVAAPGGQPVAMAVGMALAERALAARFGKSLVDHRVWLAAGAGELSAGLTQEAAALAGQMKLDRLVLLADGTGTDADDPRARYVAHGWAVKAACADDPDDIETALSFALRSRKPTLIWCIRPALAPPASRTSANALEAWRRVGARGSTLRRAWLKRLARHPQRLEFERVLAGKLPDGWHETVLALKQQVKVAREPVSPAEICRQLVDRMMITVPELLCGRLDHELPDCAGRILPGQPRGRTVFYGNRPHGMAGCINGIALHAGALPVAVSALIDVVEQLPALRLAAALRRRIVHLAFDPGPDAAPGTPGPAWQCPELLGWLRGIAHLQVFRPACAVETAECLELAVHRNDGASLLVLSRTEMPALRTDIGANRCARGGYVLAEADGARQATLIAGGPSLPLALQARGLLADAGIAVCVVSLPCWTLFAGQDESYRAAVLGAAPRFGLETAGGFGWERWLAGGVFIGCAEPDPAGNAGSMRSQDGASAAAVALTVRRYLAQERGERPGSQVWPA